MKMIIVGGGKVGYYLAKTLLEHDYNVTLIEQDKEQSRLCANNLDAAVICADGTSAAALTAAGAKDAYAVIAVMGQDERNLVCCQMAKSVFGCQKTIARVNDPKNASVLKTLGVDIVLSATENIIQSLEHEVDLSAVKALIPMQGDDATLLEIALPEDYKLHGTELKNLRLPYNCNIAAISRNGHTIIPRGQARLMSGDIVLIVALNNEVRELKKALKIKD